MARAETENEDLLSELTVVDTEVHTAEKFPDLLEYIEDEAMRADQAAGYTFGPDDFGPIPWDGWDRTAGGRIDADWGGVPEAEAYDDKREEFGIDKVVFSPGAGFKIFQIPDKDVRVTLMRAMNRLMVDRFVRADDTNYGKIHIVPDDLEESVEEIEKYGDRDGIVSVFFANMLDYPFGHERYEPIYEAAERYDLPIFLHGESSIYPGFPTDGFKLDKYVSVHTLVHPILQMWHATSIIAQEIPERYDVDLCFLEAGQSWVQLIARRMDREYIERPNDAPGLTQLPSDYLAEFYYGTQPLEEPQAGANFGDFLAENRLEDQLVMATDFPHMDFDSTASVADHEGLTAEQKTKILQDNPRELMGI